MFGYVRPLKSELKVREYEQFRGIYCGLCHALKKCCGFSARFIINYDFTFLAMLISDCTEKTKYCRKRCIASPIRKKVCVVQNGALEMCADMSVILTYWKIKDSKCDEKLPKRIAASAALLFLKRAYRKSTKRYPEFETIVRGKLLELMELEKEKCSSLDKMADCFAQILKGAVSAFENENARVYEQMLYHIGRWIYIIDALDDYDEDAKSNSFNPLFYRFNTAGEKLSDEIREYIRITLEQSISLAASAFELLPCGPWNAILENTVYLGLPWVTGQVLAGTWQKKIDDEWRSK